MKSGVFSCALDALLEGVSVNCLLFTQIVIQCIMKWRTTVTPLEEKPEFSSC